MTDQELDMMKILKMNIHLQQKEIDLLKQRVAELETSNAEMLHMLEGTCVHAIHEIGYCDYAEFKIYEECPLALSGKCRRWEKIKKFRGDKRKKGQGDE